MAQHLLEGEVDNRDAIIIDLKTANQRLLEENLRLEVELASARGKNSAVVMLRRQLQPLYNALRAVFGEIEAAGVGEAVEPSLSVNPHVAAVWESWKRKLPGKKAEVLQALLEHGEMTVPQLRVATHSGNQTVYDVTSALFRLGLLNKNGGKYSLKEL